MFSATYSPDDNKLRLYASSRLDSETYARVRAAGFIWAPKQDLFVAPMWTPYREDLLTELAGEIGDEDSTLIERAEVRADRFEEYSDKRADDAEHARKAVSAIADNIPLGQPILVGHHSERHARKDAERIENGMRKAVKMWKTSQYWQSRAAGAIRHAKYKEQPSVRARRIKGLEADKRKQERNKAEAERAVKVWELLHTGLAKNDGTRSTFLEAAIFISGRTNTTRFGAYSDLRDGKVTPEAVQSETLEMQRRNIASAERWIEHLSNRLAYEKAMLDEAGASDLLTPKPKRELAPLLNYRAEGGRIETWNQYHRSDLISYPQVEMTKAEYAAINQDKGARLSRDNSHRFRTAMRGGGLVCVFLTDSKAHEQPEPGADTRDSLLEQRATEHLARIASAPKRPEPTEQEKQFSALAVAAKAGVQVVAAPQLFPTPSDLADRMVELAAIEPEHRVLEPSAGTGNLLRAMPADSIRIAVEIVPALAGQLHQLADVHCADFLQCNGDLGTFDRIVMNPPFASGADIRHIEHAAEMLRPGGRLVALCANGPRQNERLRPLASEWIDLPAGSFKEAGTSVNVALLIIDRAD